MKLEIKQKDVFVHYYVESNTYRKATIIFCNGKFQKADFNFKGDYDFQDWDFLTSLGKLIKEFKVKDELQISGPTQ